MQLLTPLPQALADGNVVVNLGRSRGDKKKVKGPIPGKVVKFAAEVRFLPICDHRAPPSRWNSLTSAAQPADADPATFLPRAPSKPQTSEGGAGRGRLAGPARARRPAGLRRPRPGHLWRKRPLSGLSALQATVSPRPGLRGPSRPAPAPSTGYNRRRRPRVPGGRGEAGPAQLALRGPT